MKKTYEKPYIEFVDFNIDEILMVNLDEDLDISAGGSEDDEWS